jgi:hypothetical protein
MREAGVSGTDTEKVPVGSVKVVQWSSAETAVAESARRNAAIVIL